MMRFLLTFLTAAFFMTPAHAYVTGKEAQKIILEGEILTSGATGKTITYGIVYNEVLYSCVQSLFDKTIRVKCATLPESDE